MFVWIKYANITFFQKVDEVEQENVSQIILMLWLTV